MATYGNNSSAGNPAAPKKADVILKCEQEISYKQDELVRQIGLVKTRVQEVADQLSKTANYSDYLYRQNSEIYLQLKSENEALKQELLYLAKQNENIFSSLSESMTALAEQIKAVSDKVDAVREEQENCKVAPAEETCAEPVAEEEVAAVEEVEEVAAGEEVVSPAPQPVAEIDYEKLASAVAEKLSYLRSEIDYDKIAEKVSSSRTEVDYDKIADMVSVTEYISPDYIASRVAEQIVIPAVGDISVAADEERIATLVSERVSVDNEKIAELVAEKMNIGVNEERIAELVSEKIVIPEYPAQICATPVCAEEYSPAEEKEPVYEEVLADTVEVENVPEEQLVPAPALYDEEELADMIALRVGSLKSEDFEILVDDEGCESVAKEISQKLDYDIICAAISEKLKTAIEQAAPEELDYDEIARRVSEKINVPVIDEDALADKAAAALSNYLPDYDELADKVTTAVLEAVNSQPAPDNEELVEKIRTAVNEALDARPSVDTEEICNNISERLIQTQADIDYDIVIDEEGISKITTIVSEEIEKDTASLFSQINTRLDETAERISRETSEHIAETNTRIDETAARINEETSNSIAETNTRIDETAARINEETSNRIAETNSHIDETVARIDGETSERIAKTDARFDRIDGEIADIKKILQSGAVIRAAEELAASEAVCEEPYEEEEICVEEEQLVTVSDLVEEQENREESASETEEEVQAEDDGILETIGEQLTEGEIMPDGFGESSGGVDFINMMKYDRSFIARIIQSSDEQKGYYGQVKQALLSYKKVNSNVAWGSERFNKGRETIARFKIRGKTLCLYLALDPKEYPVSVYHHADVSDNKSVNGTPMMVKIKSPRGAKKAIRLIDEMLAKRNGIKRNVPERDYAAMYPYETIEELIEDGLVKDVNKNK